MSKVTVQNVFKVNPGADMARIGEIVKESAVIWRRHGAEVSFWSVSTGEIGNMVFASRFANMEQYGKCSDAVFADPSYPAWQAKAAASGLTSWVRSNILREISLN